MDVRGWSTWARERQAEALRCNSPSGSWQVRTLQTSSKEACSKNELA